MVVGIVGPGVSPKGSREAPPKRGNVSGFLGMGPLKQQSLHGLNNLII